MGVIVELKCSNCKFHESFKLGLGMQDHTAERIVSYFSAELAKEVREKLEKNGAEYDFDNGCGQCRRCRRLNEIPMLLFKGDTEGSIHENCSCGGELKLYSSQDILEERKLPACPRCGMKLVAEETGYWD